jgi:hypothetical protein
MIEGTLYSFGLLLIGCFNATAAQDSRVNAGPVITQMAFLVPGVAALAVAFATHVIVGFVVLAVGVYLWKELT